MFSQLLHVSEINFCLSLESLALYIPCAAALLSSLNTSPLLLACCCVRVICVHAPAGWVSISLFPLNWSTALYTTATNNEYCTSAWLNKVRELCSPKHLLWKQGLVFLKTVSTDQQHVPPADGHSCCSCTQMLSLPQTIVWFSVFAALFSHPWLCWCPRQHFYSVLNADQTWVCLEHDHLYPTFLPQFGYLCGSSAVCYCSLC